MISRWYLIPSTADPAREIARSFVVKAISRWYFHHSGAVAMPPCCGSYCNSYGRPSWLLQLPRQYLSLCHRSLPRGRSRNQNRNHQNNSRLHRQMIFPFWKDGLRWPRQYDIAMIFLKGLREDIHNQVEKTNAQWMASDPSSSCIRGPTGLLYRFACQLSALSLDAQWMAPSSSCIRSPTGQSSMESETHKVWFSGAHAPNRNAKSPFSPKSEAQVSKQILGRSSGRHPQSSWKDECSMDGLWREEHIDSGSESRDGRCFWNKRIRHEIHRLLNRLLPQGNG